MSIGTKLQTLRLDCKISQQDLGFFFKPALSTTTISRIENGTRNVPKTVSGQLDSVVARLEGLKLVTRTIHNTKKMRGRTVKSRKVSK